MSGRQLKSLPGRLGMASGPQVLAGGARDFPHKDGWSTVFSVYSG